MTYFAERLNAGVMIASPGLIGAKTFAACSSSFPAALWITPDTPLPDKREGCAENTITSALAPQNITEINIYTYAPFLNHYFLSAKTLVIRLIAF
jgi:hypothetical protein